MAPPLVSKLVLSPEPPDTGKCVFGPTTAIGENVLALLADGAFRALRGECVYVKIETKLQTQRDIWAEKTKPENIAILAPTPAKAAAILQNKTAIENRCGSAVFERQEKWTNFIIGPILKKVRCLEGFRDPMDGLLSEELAAVKEIVPICYMNWILRFQDDQNFGHIRISAPKAKSNKFPPRLRLFGEAVFVQRIRQRQKPIVCDK
ncbi:hypothetical protein EPUL_005063 [Erysiphe pulchra]|uniref:Uncharacterized protein n=1 Tax=Erysiphe pulchra TaxID=225359 RepID=A0A2S4PNU8_9PEZI|nr:hypothetical protein EPUL_005063 [Erysiphe pulchra]